MAVLKETIEKAIETEARLTIIKLLVANGASLTKKTIHGEAPWQMVPTGRGRGDAKGGNPRAFEFLRRARDAPEGCMQYARSQVTEDDLSSVSPPFPDSRGFRYVNLDN